MTESVAEAGGVDVAAVLRAHRSRLDPQFVIDARRPASVQGIWSRHGEQRQDQLRITMNQLGRIPKPLVNRAVRRRQAVLKDILRVRRSGVLGVRTVVSGGLPGLGKR